MGATISVENDNMEIIDTSDIPDDMLYKQQNTSQNITEETEELEKDIPEEDIPEEDIPEEDIPEEDIPEEDIPEEDIPEEIEEEDIPEDILEEDIPEEIEEEDIPEDILEEIEEEDIPEDILEEIEEEDIPEDIPRDILEEIEEYIPKEISFIPKKRINRLSDISECTEEDITEEDISEYVPDNNSYTEEVSQYETDYETQDDDELYNNYLVDATTNTENKIESDRINELLYKLDIVTTKNVNLNSKIVLLNQIIDDYKKTNDELMKSNNNYKKTNDKLILLNDDYKKTNKKLNKFNDDLCDECDNLFIELERYRIKGSKQF